MKTRAKRYQIALLLTLLVPTALTIYAQRAAITARKENPNLTWGQALAAAFTGNKPTATTFNHERSKPDAPQSRASANPKEQGDSAAAMEPTQSGGSFNITESVIAGGGERSAGGAYDQTGTTGQSALGEASGGTFSVAGGFWQGAACFAPAISQQPQPQTVCVGSSVSFNVAAMGTGLTYQWRKNTVNISGANAATYNIPSVAAGDAGSYDVVITGGCGTVTSNPATLTVNAGATITQQPQSQTVCVTQPAMFSVGATGTGLTYQWRKNTVNIPGATNPTYSIPATMLGDADSYDVVITAACGSLTSTAATLTVNPATAINTQPVSQTVCPGAPAGFSVGATGAGLTYQWRKGGVNIPGANAATYNFASATAADAGNYDVMVAGACGTVTSSVASLTVNAATTITTQPSNQTACPGGPATFSVTATGTNLTYQWRKGGVNIAGATAGSYQIAAAAAGDAGSYDVVVTGACGTVTSSAAGLTLNVTTAINTQPVDQTVCVGAPATFSVTAVGTNLTYQWRKGGVNIPGATAGSYNIPATVAGDTGSYDVVVTGGCGTITSSAAALTVNPLTAITTQPVSQNANVGAGVTFNVAATGTVPLAYQWRKNTVNIPGATSSSYNLASVVPGDAGNYDVVVTGGCGTATSNPATLTIGCQTITVNPPNTTLTAGTLGTPYSQTFTQTGGIGAIVWSGPGGGLPGGLTLNASTGELAGAPTATGNFTFTIRATDANNCFGERTYTLTINAPPCPTVSGISPNNGAAGANVTITGANFAGVTAVKFSNNVSATFNIVNATTITTTVPAGAVTGVITISKLNCTDVTTGTFTVFSPNGLQFFPLPQPVRALETRAGFNGCVTPGVPVNAGGTLTLPVLGGCTGIPANARAVTGNITVVPSGGGFLTLFPSTATQPTVANSNFASGEITNNVFTVGLGTTGPDAGAFKIFSSATTHVIVDVTGYYAPPGTGGLYFHPLATPVRLLETRAGFNGCFAPGTPLVGNGDPNADPNLDLAVQGRSPIPSPCNSIPASAQVLVGNATSVFPGGGGYLTIYPSGGNRPLVASSNYAGNDVINGPFAVKLGADGKFKIYTLLTTHLVVDILGYYSEDAVDANGAGLLFNPLPEPVRLLETRPGGPPLTGCTRTNAPIPGDINAATHTQPARNFCGLPTSAQAVVGNVSVVNTAGAGFLTLFPGNLATAPLVATSNYPTPATFGYNRHFFVGLSPADGTFKVLTQFTTDLILDASGYFAP